MSDMKKLLQAVEGIESASTPTSAESTGMKKLLETVVLNEGKVDDLKVDHPDEGRYVNEPKSQTIDSKTMQDSGNDLHKQKKAHKAVAGGDNARSLKETAAIKRKLQARWNGIVKESKMSELDDDLKTMSGAEFKEEHGMTKAEMRKKLEDK